MKELSPKEALRLLSPSPFALLTVRKENGCTNLAAVSWWTYLSNSPPLLGVSLGQKGMSGEAIRRRKEFTLCIVGKDLREKALKCGQCSGRDVDKAAAFDIPLEAAAEVSPDIVSGARLVFECRLVDTQTVGDHVFHIGEIVTISGDPEVPALYAFDGYKKLDTI